MGELSLEHASSGAIYRVGADGATACSIGRDDGCDVTLSDASVSRRHCSLALLGAEWFARDLGSRNGTEVDGVRLLGDKQVRLKHGGRLKVGSLELIVRLGDPAGQTLAPGKAGTPAERAPPVAAMEFSLDQFVPREGAAGGAAELSSEFLYRAQQALYPAQPLDTFVESLLQLVLAYVPAERASVAWVSGDGEDGELFDGSVTLDNRAQRQRGGGDFLMSRALAQRVIAGRKAVLIRHMASDAELNVRASIVRERITSAVAAPMFDGEEILGILYADLRDGDASLGEGDVAVISLGAAIAGPMYVAAKTISGLLRSEAELRHELDELRRELGQGR